MDFHVKNVKSITCYFILTIHGIHRNYSGQNLYLKKKGGTASSFRGPRQTLVMGVGVDITALLKNEYSGGFLFVFVFTWLFVKHI